MRTINKTALKNSWFFIVLPPSFEEFKILERWPIQILIRNTVVILDHN
jgi:hypothetical protein